MLLLLLSVTVTAPASANLGGCRASDYTSGVGGQDVQCTFVCNPNDLVGLTVEAMDADASVQGEADCGGAVLSCSGKQTGSDDGASKTGGAGACAGHSSEVIDSGLNVTCTTQEIWPPTIPRVCLGDICICVEQGRTISLESHVEPYLEEMDFVRDAVGSACDEIRPFCAGARNGDTIWMVGYEAVAIICGETSCQALPVLCQSSNDVQSWRARGDSL